MVIATQTHIGKNYEGLLIFLFSQEEPSVHRSTISPQLASTADHTLSTAVHEKLPSAILTTTIIAMGSFRAVAFTAILLCSTSIFQFRATASTVDGPPPHPHGQNFGMNEFPYSYQLTPVFGHRPSDFNEPPPLPINIPGREFFIQRQRQFYDDDAGPNPFSCQDRCHTGGFISNSPCQCNKKCMEHGDCCADYKEECLSCEGRCDFRHNRNFPCQCNQKCSKFNDCCEDQSTVCKVSGSSEDPDNQIFGKAPVTDDELAAFTEELFTLEGPNNVASMVRVNLQNRTTFGSQVDRSSRPLLEVNANAYKKPSIAKLLPLHNNYVPGTSAAEMVTTQETQEESQFLDEILQTPIMQKTGEFLVNKTLIITQRRVNGRLRYNNRAFRDALHQIWFGLYRRERNGPLSSSGFEHSFLGETKNSLVSGFHNWVFFSMEEAKNNLDYYGYIKSLSLGPKGSIIKHNFKWIGSQKPVSTMFIGTSPELEMALYTICFYARPGGARCPIVLNKKRMHIQTHAFNQQGKQYIGSAYPDF